MIYDAILITFIIGLLITPLSSDYSRSRFSKIYNKVLLAFFKVPEKYLISEYGRYRPNGSLAMKQYFLSGNLLKEIHYADSLINPYATYYYNNNILSRVEFYSEDKVTAMNITEETPNSIPIKE